MKQHTKQDAAHDARHAKQHESAHSKHEKKNRSAGRYTLDSILTDIENAKVFTFAGQSCRRLLNHWPWLMLAVLIDILHIFFSAIVMMQIVVPLIGHIQSLMVLVGQATGGVMNMVNETAAMSTAAGTLSTTEFNYHLSGIFKWFAAMIVAAYVLWIIFQGLNWYVANRIALGDRRLRLLVYWKNFAIQTLPFYLAMVLLVFLSTKFVFDAKMSVSGLISGDLVNFLFIMLTLVLCYFGALCYSMTGRSAIKNIKECFPYGAKKFLKTIQTMLFLIVLLVIIELIMDVKVLAGHQNILLFLGIFLFLPYLTYARVMLFRATEEYWPSGDSKPKKHK